MEHYPNLWFSMWSYNNIQNSFEIIQRKRKYTTVTSIADTPNNKVTINPVS